ncbi:hypothetical protein Bca4012_083579 [Brassica carinata]
MTGALAEIRDTLLFLHHSATLCHDVLGQANTRLREHSCKMFCEFCPPQKYERTTYNIFEFCPPEIERLHCTRTSPSAFLRTQAASPSQLSSTVPSCASADYFQTSTAQRESYLQDHVCNLAWFKNVTSCLERTDSPKTKS